MKILIVSGFLGAGKTTFIQELINRTGERFVVLENEFGDTDVDAQVLKQDDAADVWDLTEGCVCCTKSSDMISSVVTIESVLSPEYLIVEPSGVGKLSNVMGNLQKIEYERQVLLKPITIIDGQSFVHDYQAFADVYQDQIAAASIVLLSKPDHPSSELVEQVQKIVAEANPEATLVTEHYTQQSDEWFRGLLRQTYAGGTIAISSDGDIGLETCHVDGCPDIEPSDLLYLLQDALYGTYGQVVRAKGIVPTSKEWLRFDIAGGQVSLTGIGEGESGGEKLSSTSVWIGRGLDRLALMRALNPLSLEERRSCSNGHHDHGHSDGHDHGHECGGDHDHGHERGGDHDHKDHSDHHKCDHGHGREQGDSHGDGHGHCPEHGDGHGHDHECGHCCA